MRCSRLIRHKVSLLGGTCLCSSFRYILLYMKCALQSQYSWSSLSLFCRALNIIPYIFHTNPHAHLHDEWKTVHNIHCVYFNINRIFITNIIIIVIIFMTHLFSDFFFCVRSFVFSHVLDMYALLLSILFYFFQSALQFL